MLLAGLRRGLFVAGLLVGGCSPSNYDPCFDPPSIVHGTQVLAVRADPPEALYRPGDPAPSFRLRALVAAPPVLFLDEPTTGLDPRSRTGMWDVIRELVQGGTTLLLTTQYLEEADRLADDVVVIDRGRALAQGRPDQLKRQVGGERIEVTVLDPAHVPLARELLSRLSLAEVAVGANDRSLTAPVAGGAADLRTALQLFSEHAIDIGDVGLRRPTLDDVFLALTGHGTADEPSLDAA